MTGLKAIRSGVTVLGLEPELATAWENSIARRIRAGACGEELVILVCGSHYCGNADEARNARHRACEVLVEKMGAPGCNLRVVVTIPESTPDSFHLSDEALPAKLLIHALVADADPNAQAGRNATPWVNLEQLPEQLSQNRCGFVWKWRELSVTQFYRLCLLIQAFPKTIGDGYAEAKTRESLPEKVDLPGFARFVRNPTGYRAKELHGAGANNAEPDGRPNRAEGIWARKLRLYNYLASRVFVSPSLPLKVLIVENNPDGLTDWNDCVKNEYGKLEFHRIGEADTFGYLRNAEYFVIDGYTKNGNDAKFNHREFARLRTEAGRKSVNVWRWESGNPDRRTPVKITDTFWDEIDVVLQDIMLGGDTNEFTGLDLAPHYLEACPQALVFLITGMDIESVVTSGDVNWRYVDAVISKRRLDTLWWEYYRCFRERFGRMFWPAWQSGGEKEGFGDRNSLRKLIGCLRKWQIETAILGHGQGVAEMIDHADRHIGCLWRMTDSFIGEFLENSVRPADQLSIEDLMLLALGVWLHDTGHRGDEFHDDAADVRMFHAGISERLLLRDPDAYGLEWLLEYCNGDCMDKEEKGRQTRLGKCRNRSVVEGDGLCPIRAAGLLCRHHQSNAPLHGKALTDIQSRGKTISPYSRVKAPGAAPDSADYEEELKLWTDPSKPLEGWSGSNVRTLEDFSAGYPSLVGIGGLLRMLDGIQLDRRRVGSATAVRSFEAYLSNRSAFALRKMVALDSALVEMTPGTRKYLAALGERQKLETYHHLLHVQHVHYWRQLVVHSVEVHWTWEADANGIMEIGFLLDDGALERLKDEPKVKMADGSKPFFVSILKPQVESLKADKDNNSWEMMLGAKIQKQLAAKFQSLREVCEWWALHVVDDLILKEHKSQKPKVLEDREPYCRPLGNCRFRVSLLGLASERIHPAIPLFESL